MRQTSIKSDRGTTWEPRAVRTCSFETGLSNDTKVFLFDKMKNCLEYLGTKLTNFIVTFGVFSILDVLRQFQVVINVITLDKSYLKFTDL